MRAVAFLVLSMLALGVLRESQAQESAASKLFGPVYPRRSLAVGYQVDPKWPDRSNLPPWGEMPGIAVDGHDHVWTFNRGVLPVQVFTSGGQQVRQWGEGAIGKAHHVRVDFQGNVWLSDIGLHVIRKFTPEGQLLQTLGTPGEAGEDSTHFNMPTDIAVAPEGDIYVSDGYGNNRVVQFTSEGQFVRSWGQLGTGPGEFSLPHAIARDSQGRLYVADRNNSRIQIFDASGQFLTQWRDLMVPWHIWITPKDELYVGGSSPDRWVSKLPIPGVMVGIPPKDQMMMKMTTDGRVEQVWVFPMGEPGKEKPGELDWLHGMAVDSGGNLYLGDIKGQRAQKFVRLEAEDQLRPQYVDQKPVDEKVKRAVTPPK